MRLRRAFSGRITDVSRRRFSLRAGDRARTTRTFPRAAGQAGSGQQDVSYCYLGRDDSQLPDEAMMQYVTSAYSPFQSVFM